MREERFRGLYKGVVSPLVCLSNEIRCSLPQRIFVGDLCIHEWPCLCIIQALHEGSVRRSGCTSLPRTDSRCWCWLWHSNIVSVAPSDFATPFLTFHSFRLIASPTELVKIRQQNVLGGRTSAIKVAMGIFKQSGIRGLYRGLSATALRDTGYGAYFMAVRLSYHQFYIC